MRQRIFTNHTSKAKTSITEEFTIRSLAKDLDNIIILKDVFLPNLHVYDGDGEQLPVINNDITLDRMNNEIKHASDLDAKKKLQEYVDRIKEKKLHVIWIKLPHAKKMNMNDVKIINFKYDAKKRNVLSSEIKTRYVKNLGHSVFLIIKKPEDYDFANKPHIGWTDFKGNYKIYSDWKINYTDPADVSETVYSLSIGIKPKIVKDMSIKYSFSARGNVVNFPLITLGLISVMASVMIALSHCDALSICGSIPLSSATELVEKKIEVGGALVAAALVLPRLIRNDTIRDDYKIKFLIPLGLAILIFL